jgi:hypothetical protein
MVISSAGQGRPWYRPSRSTATSLPGWSTNTSTFVADHNRPSNNLPFHLLVLSLGGIKKGSTTKVFGPWKQVMTQGTYDLKLKRPEPLSLAGEGPQL